MVTAFGMLRLQLAFRTKFTSHGAPHEARKSWASLRYVCTRGFEKGRAHNVVEVDFVSALIMGWIEQQMDVVSF